MNSNTYRKSRKWLLLLVLAAVSHWTTGARGEEPRRPNIVFFIADDLGYKDIGAFGQDKIRTPNIDRLASEGIKLTSHYAGNAVCATSRCVLLSGYHPGHAYVRDNAHADNYALEENEGQIPVPAGYLRLPLGLKSLGYTTGGYGKWGEGPIASTGSPLKQGFDHFGGYICQSVAHNYYPSYIWDDAKQVFLKNPEPAKRAVRADGADPQSPESGSRLDTTP